MLDHRDELCKGLKGIWKYMSKFLQMFYLKLYLDNINSTVYYVETKGRS